MEYFKTTVVLFSLMFSCIFATSYWKQLVPEGKEVIYDYRALVKAGTHVPHVFASEFLLNGKLHIQLGSSNELLVCLKDLKYELDNGRESEERKAIKQPADLVHITKPFKIIYEDNGLVKEIVTEKDDPDYSLNIKKALAVMLQVNWEKVVLDSVKPHAFSWKEKSLVGIASTLYNVIPQTDTLKIYRMHHMPTTEYLYKSSLSDIKQLGCEAAYEEPITHDTQKLYVIDRQNHEKQILKYMESNGGVYFQPSQAKSFAFYIYINQTFNMLETIDKQTSMTIQNEFKHASLKFVVSENGIPFEKVSDLKSLIPIVENMLSDIVEYIKEDKIDPVKPNVEKSELINRVMKVLALLDITTLEELYVKLTAKTGEKDSLILKIFQQLLPMIGTRNSLKFIFKSVQGNKFEERVAIDILQSMPFNVKIPTVQMITELDGMLHLTDLPWSVQKTSILSFGTLLYKLYEFSLKQEIEIVDIFQKYIEQFVNKLKTSEKLEEKYLYLDTLFNMNNDLVIKYLEPLVKGEWFNDNNLRYKGMTSLSSVLVKHIHSDKMYELYFPILTDTTLPTYMRTVAFYFIMKSKPDLSYQINIYSFMQHEKDVDLLNFYYTYLKSLTESKNPCLYRSKLQAKQLLLYWPISYVHSITQLKIIDLTNWKYNYGETHNFALINTKDAIIFMWAAEHQSMHTQHSPNTFYVKITGLDRQLLDNIHLNTKKESQFFNYDKLFDLFASINKNNNFEIEIIHMKHRQIVETYFFNKDSVEDLFKYFKFFYENHYSENKKSLEIHYDKITKILVPTDIGFPALFETLMPSIHETKANVIKEKINNVINIKVDNKYRLMNYLSHSLSYHNPIASVWQGISKYSNMDSQLPIYFDVALNPQQNVLKLTWKRHQDKNEDVIGYRAYAVTYVFINDYLEKGILKKINPTAHNFVRVGHPDNYKHNVTLINTEEFRVGYKYVLSVFDDENPKYYQKFPLYQDFFLGTEPWTEKLMKLWLYQEYLQKQPDVAERGVTLKIEPSTDNPVTSIDLTVRFNHELLEGDSLHLPAMKINTRATYSTKKEDKTLNSWDVIAAWDLNSGHTTNSWKIDVTQLINGQNDYKICIQGSEKYSQTDITAHMIAMMGHFVDGKCNKDESMIEFSLKGDQLPEQKQRINNFEICHKPIMPLVKHIRPYSCYADRSTLRYYTIDVKTTKFPAHFKDTFINYFGAFIRKYQDNYIPLHVSSPNVTENNLKIQLRYPISKDVIDMRFITPTVTYKFKSLPATDFARFAIYPDNLYYSNSHYILHALGLTNTCIADGKDLINMYNQRLSNIPIDDWTLILGESLENTKTGLWIKHIDDKLAFKIVVHSHSLLVMPSKEKYVVTLDGKDLGDVETVNGENFTLMGIEGTNTLVYFSKYSGLHLIYNGYQILVELPSYDINVVGKCVHTA